MIAPSMELDKLLEIVDKDPPRAREGLLALLQKGPAEGNIYLGIGSSYFFEKEYESALSWYEKAEQFPDSRRRAIHFRSISLLLLSSYPAIITLLEEAIPHITDPYELCNTLGHAYLLSGFRKEAEKNFRSSLAIDPLQLDLYFPLARALGRPKPTVAEMVDIAISIVGQDAAALNALAEAFAKDDKPWLAKGLYETSIKIAPDDYTYGELAKLLWDVLDDKQSAVDHMRQAIKLDPAYLYYYLQVGEWMIELDQYDELLSILSISAEHNVKDVQMISIWGRCYAGLDNWPKATGYFILMTEYLPDKVESFWYTCQGYNKLRDYKRASEIGRQGLSLDADHPDLLEEYAIACYELGALKEARSALVRRISLGDAFSDTYYMLARLLNQIGDPKAGVALAEKWEAKWPDDYRALLYGGLFYQHLGEPKISIKCLERFIQLLPDGDKRGDWYWVGMNNIAFSCLDIQQYEKARQCFEICLDMRPLNPVSCYGMGEAARLTEKYEEAKAWFDKTVFEQDGNASLYTSLASLPIKVNPSRQLHLQRAVELCDTNHDWKAVGKIYTLSVEFDLPLLTYRYGRRIFEEWEATDLSIAKDAYIKADLRTKRFRDLLHSWQIQATQTFRHYLSAAIVTYYCGDPVGAYDILQEMLYYKLPLNAMAWYYVLLIADHILSKRQQFEEPAKEFARKVLSSDNQLTSRDRYYAALTLYMCGDQAGAVAALEAIAHQLPAAQYALAELYGKQPDGNERKAAYLAQVRAGEWGGDTDPVFQLGIRTLYPSSKVELFLSNIRDLLYFMEQQHIIAHELYGPLEIREAFITSIRLDPEEQDRPELYLGSEYQRARDEFLLRGLSWEQALTKAASYRLFGQRTEMEIGGQLYNAARREMAEIKEHEDSDLINFRLEIAAIGVLLKDGSLYTKQGSHLMLYVKYCMDGLPIRPSDVVLEFFRDEAVDMLIEGVDPTGKVAALKKIVQLFIAMRKTFVAQKRQLMNYPEFLETLKKLEQEEEPA